jgi:hypothetical protein
MSLTTETLSGETLGGTDQAYVRLLVIGKKGDTISGGFRVGTGNGAATPLGMDSTGIWIISSGNKISRMISMATADRDVKIADGAGFLFPANRAVLASDQSTTSTSQAAVSSFSVAVEASSLYSFEMLLLVTSAATTTGVKLAVTGPSEIDWVSYVVSHISANALGTGSTRTMQTAAWSTEFAATDAPAANTVFPILVRGFFKTTSSTPTSPIGLTIATEVNASQVTLKAGSEILVTKRN